MPASTSKGIFRYLEETVPGVIETGGPQIYRVTGGTLAQTTESTADNELRADRGKGDSTLTSGSVGGPLNINLSHKTHDDFLQALLANTYDEVDTNGVITVVDMAFDTGTDIISSATSALPLLEKGQFFQIPDANNALNIGIYKASSSVAPTVDAIEVDTAVKEVGATDTAQSTTLSSSRLKQSNGTLPTFTIERELEDVSQFFTWAGVYVSSLNLGYTIGDKVAGNFGFMAQESEAQGTATDFAGIGSEVAATTTPYFNSVTNTFVLIDGVDLGESCAESFTLDINANLRERRCIGGGLSASSIGEDQFTITGSANLYFGSTGSAAIYNKKLTDLPITFAMLVTDSEGNGFAVSIPRGKITAADVDGGSLNSDVMMSLAFDAVTDPDFGTMVIIDRLGTVA